MVVMLAAVQQQHGRSATAVVHHAQRNATGPDRQLSHRTTCQVNPDCSPPRP
jgi:hypothetical protein